MGSFASGVRVGPSARLPSLPAQNERKKWWRLPEQPDPSNKMVDRADEEASADTLTDNVTEVVDDQSAKGLV